jgi:hypothetical protein
VNKGDLVVEVDVTAPAGAASVYLSPPSAPGMWNFNIVRMAPKVRRSKRANGLVLDGSELDRRLIDRRANKRWRLKRSRANAKSLA